MRLNLYGTLHTFLFAIQNNAREMLALHPLNRAHS
jgi:hypothetical protein